MFYNKIQKRKHKYKLNKIKNKITKKEKFLYKSNNYFIKLITLENIFKQI